MDHDQIQKLYEQYGSWMFNRAKSLLKDEESASEAVQDVFLKVLQVGSSFRGESSPWTWLYRITTNHCLNLIRSQKAWQKAFDGYSREQLRLSQDPQDREYSLLINHDSFVQLLESEDETTQNIIFSYYFEEMTQEEIVEALKISRKTVYKRLKKFMDKARERL
jgi:RNA polymerase sigma-70 factor (ECF subfamily)